MNKDLKIFDYRKKEIKTDEKSIESLVKRLIKKLKSRKLFLGVMESCTGGGLANAITNVPGASEIFKGGIVAYSTEVKISQGVSTKIIKKYSVYSPEVALEMAKVARKNFNVDIGVGITGSISRKDPNEPKSKIGEAYIGVVFRNKSLIGKFIFPSKKRHLVKLMAVLKAMEVLWQIL